jgi:hypothetical protein
MIDFILGKQGLDDANTARANEANQRQKDRDNAMAGNIITAILGR